MPDYQEKCLRIYDAIDYAENARMIPIVAYSGGDDPQKLAADNIENRLKELKIDAMTHLVKPGVKGRLQCSLVFVARSGLDEFTERPAGNDAHVRKATRCPFWEQVSCRSRLMEWNSLARRAQQREARLIE